MNYQHLVQDSLSDNKEIIERIKKELLEAQREILVAMAWFTDDDLFKILLNKADQGLEISIIIAEHADNEKLDFDLLNTKPNGEVIKIKNVGYGMMHQKFCIIDKEVVINGSYNWSKNAKNNHENVIVTNFSKTVEEFLNTFHDMKDRAIQVLSGVPINQIQVNNNYVQSQRDTKPMEKLSFQEQSLIEFKQVLDNIIATEVGSLDKGLISQSAYNRAKENNGDHQVLPQAMDSLYSNFINEIEVVAEKKTRLKNRIDEQLKLSVGNIEIKTENEINTKKENYQLEDKNLKENILNTEKEIEKAQSTIESNLKTQVPFFQAQIEKIRQKINEQRIEFVKPPIDWVKSVILCVLLFLLISYIFVFYSSVAYIFMFSNEEAIAEALRGGNVITPEVFNPHAITNIWKKGTGGILFLMLFVSIPLGLGMYEYLAKSSDEEINKSDNSRTNILSKLFNKFGGLLFILVVDAFIAYKVAININKVENLKHSRELTEVTFVDMLGTSNFWLVFILGTLGLFLFSKVFNKLIASVNKRNQTHQEAITKQIIVNLESDIEKYENDIKNIYANNDELKASLLVLNADLSSLKQRLQILPIQHTDEINDLRQLLNSFNEKIINFSNIYKSQIDNDKLPISKSEMENRCNIFMEGWSKYLYEFYAVQLAEIKTKDAIQEIENWLKSMHWQVDSSLDLKLDSLTVNN
ncbi:phospholipase D-like domain-containing protein [Sphingobacterium litopenaei]|uniref:phospholipase D n=1 Tax=Sphingobacterium litopenaei TaxID=2763500 RepID=A0ABR7YDS8_9SPHI|nr:phospholipase D-like domain-containing protein [Sphingobacterium litopenaei]MBD1429457.1 DUF1669 domain-containing protein [Sphingobacterium litopenaei]